MSALKHAPPANDPENHFFFFSGRNKPFPSYKVRPGAKHFGITWVLFACKLTFIFSIRKAFHSVFLCSYIPNFSKNSTSWALQNGSILVNRTGIGRFVKHWFEFFFAWVHKAMSNFTSIYTTDAKTETKQKHNASTSSSIKIMIMIYVTENNPQSAIAGTLVV